MSQMSGFGDSVSALLATYTKCLRLLKVFKEPESTFDGRTADTTLAEAHSRLQSSIRSDRAQVCRTYTSKLSKNGNRLEKGDARSRSALRRILDKLKTAILNLLNMVKTQRPQIDYESLMSLSSSSRIDAIRTMDQLSQRLSSPSSFLREHRRPISTSSSSTGPKSNSSRRSSNQSLRTEQKLGRNAAALDITSRHSSKVRKSDVSIVKKTSKPSHNGGKKMTKKRSGVSYSHSRSETAVHSTRIPDRRSFVSMSSDSTKLGEIPYRRSRLTQISVSSSLEDYNIRPVYPLHPYQHPPKVKRGLLRRIFGNRERD